MADTAKSSNGFGMSDAEIKKLVARELKGREKGMRNRVSHKLLVAKAKAAGLTPTEGEIDAEIAKMGT